MLVNPKFSKEELEYYKKDIESIVAKIFQDPKLIDNITNFKMTARQHRDKRSKTLYTVFNIPTAVVDGKYIEPCQIFKHPSEMNEILDRIFKRHEILRKTEYSVTKYNDGDLINESALYGKITITIKSGEIIWFVQQHKSTLCGYDHHDIQTSIFYSIPLNVIKKE